METSLLDMPFGIQNFVLAACAALSVSLTACGGGGGSSSASIATSTLGSSSSSSVSPGIGQLIAAGDRHTCAMKRPGSVSCWGDNISGQIGDSSFASKTLPSTVVTNLNDAVSITAGSDHSCALKTNGTVVCWGSDTNRQLGDGAVNNKNVPVAVSGFIGGVAVSASPNYSCGLKSDGTVQCWGLTPLGQQNTPAAVGGLTTAVTLATGGTHVCAVKADNTIVCWGANAFGQLGDGSTGSSISPKTVQASIGVNLTNATAVATGYDHTCALMLDQSVKCWGNNTWMQLGYSAGPSQWLIPTTVPNVSNAIAVSAGYRHTCALIFGGTMKCWGTNDHGQLGDGSLTSTFNAVSVSGISNAIAIATNANPSATNSFSCALLSTGDVKCWGANANGQIGDSSTTERLSPTSTSAGSVFWH